MTKDYTCSDAAKFDPALREITPTLVHRLFELAQSYLQPGATLENVEFNTECDNHTHMITSDGDVGCTIKMVTVRRKSDGANGTDVSGAFFNNLTEDEQSLVRAAHNRAHRLN